MKKQIALIAAVAMSAAVVTGCSEKEDSGSGNKLTYWSDLPAAAASHIQSMSEMTMYQELEKQTGVQVEFIHPPAGQTAEQLRQSGRHGRC